ncbi:hypothetical protein A11Q_2571 [Pseudobdellovibrio exovorus JSS]|uniref:Uncharacterized protein n=1 Tax=Pseudobdellovibrio exovorus JSS TaxID=1184267 RepID=M4VBL3_9BACT|nr:hypothetical protein A11Q_2571 [Pseudobdellovibrio exovorus JSS]
MRFSQISSSLKVDFKRVGIVILLTIVVFLAVFVSLKYKSFAFSVYERSSAKHIMEMFKVSQDSFKKEFEKYNFNTEENNRYLNMGSEVKGYSYFRDIPSDYSDKIEERYRPFLNESNYRIIVIVESFRYKKYSIWTFDHQGNLEKIYEESL